MRNQQTVHLHLSNDWDDSPQLLVHHEPEDSHHGRPAVVELDGALLQLGLIVKLVPPGLERPVAKVTREFVAEARHVLHDGDLEEPDEGEDLKRALDGDGVRAVDGGPAVGEGVEGVSRVVDVAREVDTGAGDDVAQEGELGDASVLDLDVTEAVESLLVGAVQKAEGVEESEGGLGSELTLKSPEGCGGLASRYRGEGSGGGGEGGEDGKLHHDVVWFVSEKCSKMIIAFGNLLLRHEAERFTSSCCVFYPVDGQTEILYLHTPSSGCWEAPSHFCWQSVPNLLRDENIAIVGMLNVDINAS